MPTCVYHPHGDKCPGYQPAIRFKLISKETNVLMRDGSCQDYISIVTVDSRGLPEEVRICGPIEKPINEFYIATTMNIYLRLAKDDWANKDYSFESGCSLS